MVMQIKGKFIQNATLSSDKILLKAGEALRILAQDGTEKRLIELDANGKVFVNGSEVALKSDVTSAISSSAAAAAAATQASVDMLDGKITTEKNRAEAAEASLRSDLNAEISDRQAAVSAEQSAREAADTALGGRIDSEATARAAGDASTLSDAKAYADQKISDLVAGAPAMLDTLKEIADAIANDESAAAALTAQVGQVASDLAAEVTRATAAEGAVSASLASEVSRAQAAELSLQNRIAAEETARASAVSGEASARQAADSALQAAIDAEATARASAVNAEKSRAETAEAGLAADIASEASARATAVNAEKTRAEGAEASLSAAIAAEQSARQAAVSAEESRAQAAESALDGRVSTLEAKSFKKAKFVVSAQDISNGFIELAHAAMDKSIVAFVDRLAIHEGADQDYTVSVVGGKTRMTFVNNLVDPSPEKLSEGDVLNVTYMA